MDFNPQTYTPDGVAVFGNDAQLMVRFFVHPELSTYQSKIQGVPVHHDVEMIEVFQPGEKESVKQLVTDFHRYRFPKQYEAFKEGKEQTASGTPLELLFPSEPSTVLTLRNLHIYTIQQLSALTDTGIANLPMGGRQLVDRAKKYLETASAGAPAHQMEMMQKQIAELQAQLAASQQASTETTETPQRRGPGRPPKENANVTG